MVHRSERLKMNQDQINPGSGYANYDDAHDKKYGEPWDVPLLAATKETLEPYGRPVYDFDREEVWIECWPAQGWRYICPGTGKNGGVAEGDFRYEWKEDLCHAVNQAVGYPPYVTGRLPKGVSPSNRTHVLVREANYHPDGGQVFYPTDGGPFVALLAPPGDDVEPEDFVAFYFDGSFGLQIKAHIWHQPLYPVNDSQVFRNKQGKIYACVLVDTVEEFDKYLRVPLKPEFIQTC